jgi:hypothetical protein
MNPDANKIMPDFCSRRYPFHYATALNMLAKMGVDINRVNILADGTSENYKGEVHQQAPAPGTPIDEHTQITLNVGYTSAVDFMPYQFFYGLRGSGARSSDWEDKARHLMAPFDASIVRHNAYARHEILKFTHGLIDFRQLAAFLRLFDFEIIDTVKSYDELLEWATLLPYFHFWAGNPRLVEKALSALFGYHFQIVENCHHEYAIPENIQYRLGSKSGRLGHEAILGKTFFESDSGYEVIIGQINSSQVRELLPGKPLRKKIEVILKLCMPNNLDCHIKFKVSDKKTKIGQKDGNYILGYATHI